jgi:hypothetical protein
LLDTVKGSEAIVVEAMEDAKVDAKVVGVEGWLNNFYPLGKILLLLLI